MFEEQPSDIHDDPVPKHPDDNLASGATVTPPVTPPSPPTSPPGGVASSGYTTNIFCSPETLPTGLVNAVQKIENHLKKEVWMYIEGNLRIDYGVFNEFLKKKSDLPQKPIVLLLDSFGGVAEPAYLLSMLFRRRCEEFTVLIPRWAKSAATLLALGASEIILGEDGELGPLDVQFFDYDTEERMVSALDTVQAVDQLEDSAIEVAIKMLHRLKDRTRKRYNLLFEESLHFASEITKPLFDKIDAVRYSRQSRLLREAQDYAERLLQPRFSRDDARVIASDLVTRYPTHEFVIDLEEAKRIGVGTDESGKAKEPIGLHVVRPPGELIDAVYWLRTNLTNVTVLGKLTPVSKS